MGREEYDLLKAELPNIAESISVFPESLQERVFDLLVRSLLGLSSRKEEPASKNEQQLSTEHFSNPSEAEEKTDFEIFKDFLKEKVPQGKLSNADFIVLAVYYFAHKAPEERRISVCGQDELFEAFSWAGYKPPKSDASLRASVSNAKKTGRIDYESAGKYKLTSAGKYFVEHELPN